MIAFVLSWLGCKRDLTWRTHLKCAENTPNTIYLMKMQADLLIFIGICWEYTKFDGNQFLFKYSFSDLFVVKRKTQAILHPHFSYFPSIAVKKTQSTTQLPRPWKCQRKSCTLNQPKNISIKCVLHSCSNWIVRKVPHNGQNNWMQ